MLAEVIKQLENIIKHIFIKIIYTTLLSLATLT